MQNAKCKGEYALIHITIILFLNIFGILLFGCGPMQNKNKTPVDKSLATVPAWAKEAI